MRLGPLTLFQRMHANGTPSETILLASWHWRWSLTWRWHLSRAPWRRTLRTFHFTRVYRSQGFNFHATFNSPVTGIWSLQTQPNMPNRATKEQTP